MTEKSVNPSAPNMQQPAMYPPMYQQQQQQPQQTQMFAGPVNYGPEPVKTTCPSCQQQVVTRIDHALTWKTHLFALFACSCCCCCIPYCCNSCKNTNHYCPSCNAYLGTYA